MRAFEINEMNGIVMSLSCVLYFGGLLLLITDEIGRATRYLLQYAREKSQKIFIKKKESKFDKSIRYLLSAIFGENSKITVIHFKMITVFLFLFFFFNCVRIISSLISIPIAMAIAAMPYIMLRLRLERIRSQSSNEAEILVSELLMKYKIKNFNIEEAIEEVKKLSALSSTRPLLSKLLLKLRTTREDAELRDATKIFAYSINTSWSRMLASNIYQASKSGINVSLSMEDILIQLREARKLKEKRKRHSAEPRRMFWALSLVYFLLYELTTRMFGIEPSHYFRNQFGTKQGLTSLCLMLIGVLISYFCLSLLKNKKLDY